MDFLFYCLLAQLIKQAFDLKCNCCIPTHRGSHPDPYKIVSSLDSTCSCWPWPGEGRRVWPRSVSAAVLVPSEALPGCFKWHKPTRPTICSPWGPPALLRVADDHSQHLQTAQWKGKTFLGFLGWVQDASGGGCWSEIKSFEKANFGNSQLRAFGNNKATSDADEKKQEGKKENSGMGC